MLLYAGVNLSVALWPCTQLLWSKGKPLGKPFSQDESVDLVCLCSVQLFLRLSEMKGGHVGLKGITMCKV